MFTAGSNGEIAYWSLDGKNKLNFLYNGKAVTAASVSYCGKFMAYSTGYDWAKGYEYYNK